MQNLENYILFGMSDICWEIGAGDLTGNLEFTRAPVDQPST